MGVLEGETLAPRSVGPVEGHTVGGTAGSAVGLAKAG